MPTSPRTLGAGCFHDGCTGNNWQEFKDRIGTPDAAHYDPPLREDHRPEIVINTQEHDVIDATIAALCAAAWLYQRHGVLVRIRRHEDVPDGAIQPLPPPSIEIVPPATLRELITRHARLVEVRDDELMPAHPKGWQVSGVSCRGAWDGIPMLTGISQTPLMRADGSILQEPGYDSATGIFLELGNLVVAVPDEPTRDQAREAAAELLEVFCDFPFEAPCHRSAVLALILTMFARPAFTGPTPLFLFDANVRGSGKTLAADIVGLITTGEDLARMSNPGDDNEARKRITALVIRGVLLCLIDNIVGTLGSAALDAALTATRWQDRILGHSQVVDMPMSIVWLATGNNTILAADTSRRVCPIRLNCQEEKPENRKGFRHPDLRQHVRANRGQLVSAALTILRAFHVAGRPQVDLPGWGSYESWTALIRQAIVWLGLPDPAGGRIDLMERADVQASALRMLIESWPEIDSDGTGLTTGQLLRKLSEHPNFFTRVREAILELCGGSPEKLPTVRSVGNKLRHLKGRIVGLLCLDSHPDRTGAQVWRVVKSAASGADAESAGSADSAHSPD